MKRYLDSPDENGCYPLGKANPKFAKGNLRSVLGNSPVLREV